MIIAFIVNGFNSDTKSSFAANYPTSLTQLEVAAERLDTLTNRDPTPKDEVNAFNRKKNYNKNDVKHKYSGDFVRTVVCDYCKLVGHYERNCFLKKHDEAVRTQGNRNQQTDRDRSQNDRGNGRYRGGRSRSGGRFNLNELSDTVLEVEDNKSEDSE